MSATAYRRHRAAHQVVRMNIHGIAATPREGAADTALLRNCFFDLSGCREYVGSRDSVPTITNAPSGLISLEIVSTSRFASVSSLSAGRQRKTVG